MPGCSLPWAELRAGAVRACKLAIDMEEAPVPTAGELVLGGAGGAAAGGPAAGDKLTAPWRTLLELEVALPEKDPVWGDQ